VKEVFLSRELFERASVGIAIFDEALKIIDLNKASEEMTGFSKKDIIGKHADFLLPKDEGKEMHDLQWKETKEKGIWEGEVWNRRKNGEVYLVHRTVFSSKSEQGEPIFVSFSRDITDAKNIEKKYEDTLHKDIITGLSDKHVFYELTDRVLRKSKRKKRKSALVLIDIARFRNINDTFGYTVGDQLLKEAAERLREISFDDAMLTRVAGDVFALLFPETNDEEKFVRTIEKIVQIFEKKPFTIHGEEFYLQVDMGISFYPGDGVNRNELFKNAELALSRCKEIVSERYHFYKKDLNVRVFEKILMETNIRKGIENNEFVLFYQPQVELITGKIKSAEALIRWNHPEIGLVSPGKFIPVAEESGLILSLDLWVIKEACRQNKKWQDDGFAPITIGVNISSHQFREQKLVEHIKNTLKETELDPKYLEIEITEGVLMEEIEKCIEVMKELKKIGVKISIDDFGTGYSSLNYLSKFPIDSLKIDRSFIQNIDEKPQNKAVSSVIIKLAHELGLSVVAEGVEEENQVEFLKQSHCEKYQGYYCSPAVEAEEFLKLLQKK